ncbi:MAG TPA: peptidoglycan DD-metalloendopeptidase family protein [Virgibacillus sp.]|nr:peptidoglycan DD-metalloendopeptidase family protein [Virgibacillus sp.]
MGKRLAYITAFMLLAMMLMTNQAGIQAQSIGDIEKELKELEKKQKEIQEKQGSISGDKEDTEGKINDNLDKQNAVEKELQAIDEQLITTTEEIQTKEQNIAETNQQIDELSEMIAGLENDISDLEERIKKRDALLKDRLRSIQQNGGLINYIEVILGSKSFSDFISRAAAVNTIMDQDKVIMEEQAADKKDLENKVVEVEGKKKEVEDKKVALEEQKSELIALKAQLDKQMVEKEKLMAKLEIEQEELEEYKISLEQEQEVLNNEEEALEKAKRMAKEEKAKLEQLAKEKEREREKNNPNPMKKPNPGNSTPGNPTPPTVGGSGDFIHPVPGGITSNFGWRVHPIYNTSKFHAGIDYSAGVGTSLKAAASGVVTFAGNMNGYGRTIILTHYINGKQFTTLYAHLSSISVSVHQSVSQGQVIGATGNTGTSTGPHLHFEIHQGSINWGNRPQSAVNPRNYLP